MPYFRLGGRKSQIRGDSSGLARTGRDLGPGTGQLAETGKVGDSGNLFTVLLVDKPSPIYYFRRGIREYIGNRRGISSGILVLKLGGNIGLWKGEIFHVHEWVDHHMLAYDRMCANRKRAHNKVY